MDRIYRKPAKPKYVIQLARELRKNSTAAEVTLWENLKNRKLLGLKFRRQKPIGRYIADFYCAEKGFAIELDGSSHTDKIQYDKNRDGILAASNLTILRIPNNLVLTDLDSVLKEISEKLQMSYTPSLLP